MVGLLLNPYRKQVDAKKSTKTVSRLLIILYFHGLAATGI